MYTMASKIYKDLIVESLKTIYKHGNRNALDEINESLLEMISEVD